MRSHTKIFSFTILDMQQSKDLKIYSVNSSDLILSEVNGCFQETNANKYLTLVPTNRSKEKIKKYEEL